MPTGCISRMHPYDCVIADHVLFYCDNLDAVCSEILRVVKARWCVRVQYIQLTAYEGDKRSGAAV